MKFTFRPSPNYNDKQTTLHIMNELTIGLLVVFFASVIYYVTAFGVNYGVRAIIMLLVSVVCATATEAIFYWYTKKPVWDNVRCSFPWITAIILTMMCQLETSYYALGVSTIIAIFFGKLVYGGFGQNIFNPAAFGRAVIMACFSGSVAVDIVTGATPTTTFASTGWLVTSPEQMGNFLSQYGGLGGMFLGTYPGAIGETSSLVILAVGVYLAYRRVIDWKISVTYIATIFVTTFMVGLMQGQALTYAFFHIFTGGVCFAAVFMLTDPVTNPTNQGGRIFFGLMAGFFTVLIRLKANLPEGVLYSILLANMMTPAIERMFDGVQYKRVKDYYKYIAILAVAGLGLNAIIGLTLEPKDVTFKAAVDPSKGTTYTGTGVSAIGGDVVVDVLIDAEGNILDVSVVSHNETESIGGAAMDEIATQIVAANGIEIDGVAGATVTTNAVKDAVKDALSQAGIEVASAEEELEPVQLDVADGSYSGEGKGFGGAVKVELTVKDGFVTDCKITADDETPEVGGAALDQLTAQVKAFGADIDGVTGATYTSNGVKDAVKAAFAASEEVEEEETVEAAALEIADGTYTGEGKGMGSVKVELTVAGGVITDCKIDASEETPDIGGKAADELAAQV
ncbi:MAG: RnfABCDGE type electron transport complex subunit D, partial [Erysipelotrichaceae bacterium]|nr:RnfABCDGE type electron transport complex subunit D [Erysipelotrichaceae bacterium]